MGKPQRYSDGGLLGLELRFIYDSLFRLICSRILVAKSTLSSLIEFPQSIATTESDK